jgi:hypothetical protein
MAGALRVKFGITEYFTDFAPMTGSMVFLTGLFGLLASLLLVVLLGLLGLAIGLLVVLLGLLGLAIGLACLFLLLVVLFGLLLGLAIGLLLGLLGLLGLFICFLLAIGLLICSCLVSLDSFFVFVFFVDILLPTASTCPHFSAFFNLASSVFFLFLKKKVQNGTFRSSTEETSKAEWHYSTNSPGPFLAG